ncbi:thioredoxin domain-containing protein [Chloropicon primus]|uniref:Thioredoxin domain-containing protein n=2 Tax=Chloropicon primus TaxID=1764295 RepID=A0A5B8MKF3_9CHLO|nr:hypothetical protein A3770_04p34510 [Chloropicon primus]UPR00143.1 thioredoxin domain-containing protein [Chloropicon primus]|eukprot:QDZ20933.1 hypothetical protein A3770_04p34510 [Chloropicon primus]
MRAPFVFPFLGGRFGKGQGRERPAPSSRGASARQLAIALADDSRCTLLSFYSPNCKLCGRIGHQVEELVEEQESHWLNLVRLNVEDEIWTPEVSYYSISYVPCLLLLDRKNRARAKSGVPKSQKVVEESLHDMLVEGRKRFGRKRASG